MKHSTIIEKLKQLKSGRLDEESRNLLTHEIIVQLQNIDSEKVKKSFIHFFKKHGDNLPRDFIPIIALVVCEGRSVHCLIEFFKLIREGKIKIEGKVLQIINREEIRDRVTEDEMYPIIWTLYGQWFNRWKRSDPEELPPLVSLFYSCSSPPIPGINQSIRGIRQLARKRCLNLNWKREIIKSIYPELIPSLLNWSRWKYSADLIGAILVRIPKRFEKGRDWQNILYDIAYHSKSKAGVRKIFHKMNDMEVKCQIACRQFCDVELLKELIESNRSKSIKRRDRHNRDIIVKWLSYHAVSDEFLFWIVKEDILSGKFTGNLIIQRLWDLKKAKKLERCSIRENIRKIIASRIEFIKSLKKNGIDIRRKEVLRKFLQKFPPELALYVLSLMKEKRRVFHEGEILSTFNPDRDGSNQERRIYSASDVFSIFFSLMTRNNKEMIQKGAEILGDPEFMKRARDSFSLDERKLLFSWSTITLIAGKSIFERITHCDSQKMDMREKIKKILLTRLAERFPEKKVIVTLLNRIGLNVGKSKKRLILKIGGCSWKDLNIDSSDVGCCYFKGGGWEECLLPWIVSRNHILLYMQEVSKRKRANPIGVTMLFAADDGKTIVIDSVEGNYGTLRKYPGWERWLISSIKEITRKGEAKRIVVNQSVMGDLAKKFVAWVKEHEEMDENPEPVKISENTDYVPTEFKTSDKTKIISVSLDKKSDNSYSYLL